MRVAISGTGLRSAHVLNIFKTQMPEIEFVGYVDPQSTYADRIDPDMPEFEDVVAMLDATAPDLFFVGSPNEFHMADLEAGLAAGVRIFTEKPVVTTMDDTLKLAALLSIEASEHIGPYHGAFFMRDWRRFVKHSGGFMLEKCCHDLDIYNMVTASRPARVASFGGRRSFLPEHAPAENSAHEVYHVKKSIWNSTDDPFRSDGDIIDCQTAILEYQSGASMAFHTNLNVPDEHRRFMVVGARGMAEGDFMRSFLKVTDARSNDVLFERDYSDLGGGNGHYGADEMMCADIVAYLRGEAEHLPVSISDALVAGIAALAIDEARMTGRIVDLSETWKTYDSYGLTKQ